MSFDEDTPDVDLSKIEDGLYLGNLSAAVDENTLKTYRISHVLTVESNQLPANVTSLPGMAFLYIEAFDVRGEDLLSHFQEAVDFIEDGQRKGSVLVHCYFGVSRSATLVTCFLMKKYGITLSKALKRVRSKRWCASPNAGFLAQLKLYQTMGQHLDTTNGQYRLYLLQAAATSLSRRSTRGMESFCSLLSLFLLQKPDIIHSSIERKMDDRYSGIIQPEPHNFSPSQVAYKCRGCRCPLVGKTAVLPHCAGETPEWTDARWSGPLDGVKLCDQGIFTLPSQWMMETEKPIEGKLLCPRCRAKVGSYNWYAGCCCPCQAKISPAFYFIPSKLDKCM